MSIGAGIIEGTKVADLLVGIRPTDDAFNSVSGATYVPQDDNGNGNVAYYEINNETDSIEFTIPSEAQEYEEVGVTVFTVFGPTDFDVERVASGTDVISETTGFDSDVWIFSGVQAGESLRFTNFDNTQAAFYPYIYVQEIQ